MRRSLVAAAAALLLLGGCAEHVENAGGAGHPNLIVVREFAAPVGVVTLDPSFGFSLQRGAPGVPPARRAASLGRAAAFTLADTVAEQLRALGYDAVLSNEGGPEPGGRALVVSGAFRGIDEGSRRRVGAEGGSVAVETEVAYLTSGERPQRLMAFPLDSRQVSGERAVSATARREPINAAATRLGAAIARTVAELARRNSWPGAPR